MKLIQSILGCALATGLMTVATQQVQAAAGVVIDDVLYLPLKISATATIEVKNKPKKEPVTQDDLLEALDLSTKTTLYMATGSSDDIWIIDTKTKTLDEDLTADGYLTVASVNTGSTDKGKATIYTGTVSVELYSAPVFESGVLDTGESEANSDDWLELSGDYSDSISGGAKVSSDYTAKDLTGQVHHDGETVPATGTVSASGSGALTP